MPRFTPEEIAVGVQTIAPVVAALIESLRSLGVDDKADVIEQTFAADDEWRQILGLNAPPPPAA